MGPDGVLLLDKPAGFSSTQALARAKRFLGAAKAGHTGTLDPFATGLLPLVFGEATKFSRFLIDATKAYHATLRLGVESSTGDPEGELSPARLVEADGDMIDEILRSLKGFSEQVPPMHSAVRIGGQRLYELARAGREVERAARRIEILELRRAAFAGDRLEIAVTCSKGTYIRTLAAEIGRRLGCGAYLTALRRTAVGGFGLDGAIELAQLEPLGREGARARLLPVERLVAELPRRECTAAEALRFTQGQDLAEPSVLPGAEVGVFGPDGAFLGVARGDAPGALAPLRLMATGVPKAP